MGVTEDTIRKDFQDLSARKLVSRFHGGVLKLEGLLDFTERTAQQPTVKQALAERTVELVQNRRVLYIDGGTTNLKLAESLPEDYAGTLITNAPAIAQAFCRYRNSEVIVIGGDLDKTTQIISGASAVNQIREMNIECCVLGVSSLSPEYGITFPSSSEAGIKREILQRSQEVIAIATKEKLGSVSTFFATDLSSVDILVTNETDEKILKNYRKKGLNIISHALD